MNASVQAGPLENFVSAEFTDVKVFTSITHITSLFPSVVNMTCLPLSIISINGHSLSAINPDNILIGGMATL